MDTIAAAALASMKGSGEFLHQQSEGLGNAPVRRKTTRISELLLDGNPSVKGKLEELDASTGHRRSDADASAHGAGGDVMSVGSSGHASACGSMHGGSVHGGSVRHSNPGSLAMSGQGGQKNWRKLNTAMVMTKNMASHMHSRQANRRSGAGNEPAERSSFDGAKPPPGSASFLGKCREALINSAILPDTTWYQVYWFYWAVGIALLSCWVEPFEMAFKAHGWLLVFEYMIIGTFLPDFFLKFFVAYYDPDTSMLITTQPKMAINYTKSIKFVFDLLGCFPYDLVGTAIADRVHAGEDVRAAIAWLKLLTLARAYRIFDLFNVLDYRMILSQGALMILRNYTYVFFTVHWAACMFYHVARQESNFGPDSWVGRNADEFQGKPVWSRYVLALYFSMTVFTAMGDAKLFPASTTELSLMIVYLLFNLFLAAYIIGTVTIMMVTSDEHSKAFRDSMSHLIEYSRDNELPERLHAAMKEHLVVHFDSAQTSDDQVLSIYPTTMRRRALRHLYLQPIKGCYLFRGCKQRFLDALLTAARVELFLPGVEIITEGDNVVELLIVVAGEVAVSQGASRLGGSYLAHASSVFVNSEHMSFSGGASMGRASSGMSFSGRDGSVGSTRGDGSVHGSDMGGASAHSGRAGMLGPPKIHTGVAGSRKGCSDPLAEVAFFTDGASHEAAMGTTPVRVLSLPKTAWELLVTQFPQQVRIVLENVQRATESAVQDNLKAAAARSQLTAEQLHVALSLVAGAGGFDATDPLVLAQTRDALTAYQMEMITRLDDIRAVVSSHVRKCDEMRTFEFLNTAAQGDVESLRTMINQGISANTADYDGRTGLMLASAKGHDDVVALLLEAGADKSKTDAFGISALSEAVKNAQDSTITLLLAHGATLQGGGLAVAAEMCTAVFEGDLVKLRRLLRSGAPPDACDYDKRSPLHIAGAEGSLDAVKLLVEEGGADPNFQDRWGNTALDEARRVGATAVVTYLESRATGADAGATAEKKRKQAAHDYLSWCNLGEAGKLRDAGGYSAGDEAGCAFTGLLVAASKGHTDAVRALLESMPSATAHTQAYVAMLEAARCGHPDTVAAFRAAGVALRDPASPSLRYLGAELRNAAQQGVAEVVAALLAAGVSGRADAGGGGGGSGGSAAASRGGGSGGSGGGTAPWQQAQQQVQAQPQQAGAGVGPLHLAAEHCHLEVVRRLVEQGGAHVDLALGDGLGRTPLALAAEALALHPSDPRVRAVHEYLLWATTAASRGLSQQMIAAAALDRWGPVVREKTPEERAAAGAAAGAGPAAATEPEEGARKLAGPPSGASSGSRNKGGLASPVDANRPADRLLLPQSSNPSIRDSTRIRSVSGIFIETTGGPTPGRTLTSQLSTASPALRPVIEEAERVDVLHDTGDDLLREAPAPRGRGSCDSNAMNTMTLPADGGGAAAAAAEAWDNLPGTPGGTMRGGNEAGAALKQLRASASEADLALAYTASVQHTASLLNDPPAAGGAAAALGSPRLVLPPNGMQGTSSRAMVPAAAAGAAQPPPQQPSPGRRSVAEAYAPPGAQDFARSSSSYGAAARLFGGYQATAAAALGPEGVVSPVAGAPSPLAAVPSARSALSPASASAIQLVQRSARWSAVLGDDEIERYIGSFSRGADAGTGTGSGSGTAGSGSAGGARGSSSGGGAGSAATPGSGGTTARTVPGSARRSMNSRGGTSSGLGVSSSPSTRQGSSLADAVANTPQPAYHGPH